MRNTIDMMLEACDKDKVDAWQNNFRTITQEELERLVVLVRADEAAKYTWDVHSCGPTCTKAACVAMREAVEAEREACAKVCVKIALEFKSMYCGDEMEAALICEKTIRARGQA